MADATVNATATMLKTKWYEESPGVTSSKRAFGGVALALGMAMKINLYFMAIYGHVNDAATANSVSDGLILSGATLLGLTIADNLKRQA